MSLHPPFPLKGQRKGLGEFYPGWHGALQSGLGHNLGTRILGLFVYSTSLPLSPSNALLPPAVALTHSGGWEGRGPWLELAVLRIHLVQPPFTGGVAEDGRRAGMWLRSRIKLMSELGWNWGVLPFRQAVFTDGQERPSRPPDSRLHTWMPASPIHPHADSLSLLLHLLGPTELLPQEPQGTDKACRLMRRCAVSGPVPARFLTPIFDSVDMLNIL